MKESETLIREDLHIEDLSKRIREQNEYATSGEIDWSSG